MPINSILEYQKVDAALVKLEREYKQCEEKKLVYQCKAMYKDRQEALVKLAGELEECYRTLAKWESKFDEGSEKTTLKENFEDFVELSDFDNYEKEFGKLEEELININKEVNRLVKKIAEIGAKSKELNEQMDILNNRYSKALSILQKKKEEMQSAAAPIMQRLNAMAKNIDKKFLIKYKELRENNKLPAFVEYSNGSCLGCGIDISIEVDKKLVNAGDCAECPHCGRIVIKM